MAKKKTKPLLPSLRERKRYMVYEVISRQRFFDAAGVNKAIFDAAKGFLGDLGVARAGIIGLDDKWSAKHQRGIVRVNNKHVENLKSSLVFVDKIEGKEALVRSVGASGVLKKAQQKYFN